IEFNVSNAKKLRAYKMANRKDLDISAINLVMNMDADKNKTVKSLVLAAGGLAATPIRFKKTEQFLIGKTLDHKTINQALDLVQTEFNPLSDLRASAAYRRLVVENHLSRFFHE